MRGGKGISTLLVFCVNGLAVIERYWRRNLQTLKDQGHAWVAFKAQSDHLRMHWTDPGRTGLYQPFPLESGCPLVLLAKAVWDTGRRHATSIALIVHHLVQGLPGRPSQSMLLRIMCVAGQGRRRPCTHEACTHSLLPIARYAVCLPENLKLPKDGTPVSGGPKAQPSLLCESALTTQATPDHSILGTRGLSIRTAVT